MLKQLKMRYQLFKGRGYVMIVLITALTPVCLHETENNPIGQSGDSLYLKTIPPQPGEDAWRFIDELKSPMWTKHAWKVIGPGPLQADLSKGVSIRDEFPDPENRLETAYEDLRTFLAAGNISTGAGEYVIETISSPDLEGESFRMEIGRGSCRIQAGDAEGIRRGIFQLEDEMLRIRGPYLPLGTTEKHPVVKRRISRCVYGPIKRPPAMRDELMDTVDYYPDQYLNRLAHEGVNGLWLSVDFRDLVSTKYTPEAAKDGKKRLNKLRKTVAQNLRYGIRTYLFTIEPRAWGNQPPYYQDLYVLDHYPELGGVKRGTTVYFCPVSKTARDYLYQAVNKIFIEIPDLGGMINISHGERATTCLSSIPCQSQYEGKINCPRCSEKAPWEILYASLSAMERGMHDAAPEAELISWHYMGDLADWVYEIPAHTPKGVILQFQFETGVTKTEFGKKLVGGDYWLSTPGPSERFERQAEIAKENDTPVSAKIQTGNSHEVATIPYVPAPSLIYRKFSAMHRLGVSHTMLGWYFGNYPGPMIRSAGELSFEPFPENEETFLYRLASVYWKKEDVDNVVSAWKYFAEGFGNYPLQNMLGYYGPMHDGPVWPLLLKPVDAPLAPTWQIGSGTTLKPWPPSGDRIGECLWSGGDLSGGGSMENVLTLGENVELSRRMSVLWNKGVAIFDKLEPEYRNEPERILDIGVAKALGIQFQSGYNILHFYELREKMFRMEGKGRLDVLKQLEDIIREEIILDERLISLCEKDSRLGFHSEAEGYKYFPEKIRWRMQQLRNVLAGDVPELRKLIRNGKPLFPGYSGNEPAGAMTYSVRTAGFSASGLPEGLDWQSCSYGKNSSSLRWASAYDSDSLYIIVPDSGNIGETDNVSSIQGINVRIEPRRLWPSARFVFSQAGKNPEDTGIRLLTASNLHYLIVQIPFKSFWWSDEEMHPLRINVNIQKRGGITGSWRPLNPVTSRLVFGTDNPADLGWLIFK
jgi:hypothetical protein